MANEQPLDGLTMASNKQVDRMRDCRRLMVHRDTLQCGMQRNCRPCCYKMVLYPRKGLLPNQRPEMCPRHQLHAVGQARNTKTDDRPQIGLYDGELLKRILTVGDGDFSFSLALAKALPKVQIVATSHETRESVVQTYPDGEAILNQLAQCPNAKVLHGIDATNANQMASLGEFDRILWNFPCVAMPDGEDGQNKEMDQNKQLLHGFFAHAAQRLRRHPKTTRAEQEEEQESVGEIHLTHKTKPPFNQWEIDQIAATHGFQHAFSMVFDRCLYPGYSNKKVLSKESFPIWDSQTFVFIPKTADDASVAEDQPQEQQQQPETNDDDEVPPIISPFNKTIPLIRMDRKLLDQIYEHLQPTGYEGLVNLKSKSKAKPFKVSMASSSSGKPKRKDRTNTQPTKRAHKRQRHK